MGCCEAVTVVHCNQSLTQSCFPLSVLLLATCLPTELTVVKPNGIGQCSRQPRSADAAHVRPSLDLSFD